MLIVSNDTRTAIRARPLLNVVVGIRIVARLADRIFWDVHYRLHRVGEVLQIIILVPPGGFIVSHKVYLQE